MATIGLIGGTGMGSPDILKGYKQFKKHTPYGPPSSNISSGKINDCDIVSIARHGEKHAIPPGRVNFRANIWALKELGVTHVLAVTAVGSLREEIEPCDIVFPDQFIDRTTNRASTFFDGPEVCHIPMAEPFCSRLRQKLCMTAEQCAIKHHPQGTVITIEGPRFSTKAESRMYRMWGADIINMSTVPEVVLAREAGLCYAAIAMSTDYDCWHETQEPVSWELIQKTMNSNVERVQNLLVSVIDKIDFEECTCRNDTVLSTL